MMKELWLALREARLLSGQKPDYEEELSFWRSKFRRKNLAFLDVAIQKKAFPPMLLDALESHRERENCIPRALEVGPGPVSLLAFGVRQNLMELTAVDPLAAQYEQLLTANDIEFPVRPVKGYGELLATQFGKSSFDVVYSGNAIDHAIDPIRCIGEMIRVLKPGGRIILEGLAREGSHAQWHGLHQHDLYLENDVLIYQPRCGRARGAASHLPLQCLAAQTIPFHERQILDFGYEIPANIKPEKSWEYRDWFMVTFLNQK